MGLRINVYRTAGLGDCTAGGISSRHDTLTLVNVPGPCDPSPDAPAAKLEQHYPGVLRITPAAKGPWYMMGGNYAFAATSDGRFSEACERLLGHRFYGAVAIHDRVEGGNDYGGN